MPLSRRHLTVGVLTTISLLVAAMLLRLALEWRQALADIDAMIVTPVTLPAAHSSEASPFDSNAQLDPNAATNNPTGGASGLNQSANSESSATDQVNPAPSLGSPALEGTSSSDTQPLNILLMGTDARPTDTGATRTDALVLVHLDRQSGKVSMLSLPRDLWVSYPNGLGEGRVNAAYALGESTFGPGGGPALAKATVGRLLDLKVDYFVMINFQGFRTLIDRLGGIAITVPETITDPSYPTDDFKTISVTFPKGRQFLNGERALIYARTRHADSDFGRNQRQQQVLVAIFERVRDRGLLQQLTSIDDYTGAMRGYIKTDISRGQMLDLGNFARTINLNDIRRFAIDSTMIVELKKPAGATFAAEPKALQRVVAQFTGELVSQAGGE
jgi:polyisoprenyl-teichoic acid--peptidoglycan teichoic acid transferase